MLTTKKTVISIWSLAIMYLPCGSVSTADHWNFEYLAHWLLLNVRSPERIEFFLPILQTKSSCLLAWKGFLADWKLWHMIFKIGKYCSSYGLYYLIQFFKKTKNKKQYWFRKQTKVQCSAFNKIWSRWLLQ